MKWDIVFSPEINQEDFTAEIAEIKARVAAIRTLPLPPDVQKRIDSLNIIRAIKGTTGIEGNTLSEERVAEIINRPVSGHHKNDLETQEAENALRVREFIRALPESVTQANEKTVKQIHLLNTEKCDYPDNVPGEYRTDHVVADAYSPPNWQTIPELMEKYFSFINSAEVADWHTVIRAVVAHFYLVSIHPFQDGNGRTSRAVEAFYLHQGKYNVLGFYSLANFFYKNREAYIQELQDARFKHNGNLTAFVQFCLDGYIWELESIQEQIAEFMLAVAYRDYVTELMMKGDISDRIALVLFSLSKSGQVARRKALRIGDVDNVPSFYKNLGDRTFANDLKLMQKLELIIITGEEIAANNDLMKRFAPNSE